MKRIVLCFFMLTFAFPSMAAEFEYNGEIVKSEIKRKVFDCGAYSIVIEDDVFPSEYEMKIPSNLSLKNYFGMDTYVSIVAIFEGDKSRVISPLNEIFPDSTQLHTERFYAPRKAIPAGSGVVIYYSSGGNCDYCEAFAYFEFEADGVIKKKELLSYSRYKELTK